MAQERCVLRHEVSEVCFNVFTEEEIKKLSVVRIVSSISYDRLGNPIKGGLYDPAMGPLDFRGVCITCGLSMRDCPGHMGHIVLCLDVYNPLTFSTVFDVMRYKCLECHKFRQGSLACRTVAVKLMLIDSGAIDEAKEIDAKLTVAENRAAVLASYESRLKRAPMAGFAPGDVKAYRKSVVKQFLKDVLSCKSCEHCGCNYTAIRKDGHTKLFISGKGHAGSRSKSALQEVRGGEEGPGIAADDSDEEDSEAEEEDGEGEKKGSEEGRGKKGGKRANDKYMAPVEVMMHMKLLWEKEKVLASLLWGRSSLRRRGTVGEGDVDSWKPYFWKVLPIPPSRFRPPGKNDDGSLSEHPQNSNIAKIMGLDERIRTVLQSEAEENKGDEGDQEEQRAAAATSMARLRPDALARLLSIWIELQNSVNAYIDSSKDANAKGGKMALAIPGIRQGLEKKEGLFRMHMMGKRVNFACRSVISPDPYIGTSEIGLPVRFASVLTYPQPVTPGNVVEMRHLVERGPKGYPGANFVEDAKGRLVDLSRMNDAKRKALAARLLTPPGQKVWRHLHDGDMVLMNRQPTLHKPGIMAHRARVLRNPKQQTIRMHYANCNTYNADFDGDEMNCHFPQDELSRAEAEVLACTDEQYIVPTNGKPLRGLIQDHVCSGVKLTCKDAFLSRSEFQQILFCALSGLPGVEIVGPKGRIDMPPPTVWKPRKLWTGKQVVSALLHHLTSHLPSLNLDFKAKTPPVAFGADQQESEVLIRDGELLRGVLDKAAFGASETGLVHAIYEFYGSQFAGRLLTALGRLFTIYLQFVGHTCGIEDLVLSKAADKKRRDIINRVTSLGQHAMKSFLSTQTYQSPKSSADVPPALSSEEVDAIREATADMMEEDVRTGDGAQGRAIDGFMQGVLAPLSSELIKACLPDGLRRPFPHNTFSLMVATGAKGSPVNQSQVSCSLGQQALEGRRVPLMPSGKSLPAFPAYDPSPRAGGFIADRFLTGIRPQEYFFHCMAGREGLIDTAVKTSRSGYLQRCLVKGLEELRVNYDHTVRDADGVVVEFLYGDDGVDPMHAKYLDGAAPQMTSLARNHAALLSKYGVDAEFFQRTGMTLGPANAYHQRVAAAKKHGQAAQAIEVGSCVEARRLKHGRTEWVSSSWREGWHKATVLKVHEAKGSKGPTYDVQYEDQSVAKKVPLLASVPQQAGSAAVSGVADKKVPAIRTSMPSPFTSTVHMGCTLGAVSERFQEAIQAYVETDPDRLILQPPVVDDDGDKKKKKRAKQQGPLAHTGVVSKASFQLLLWLKYMRSLAAPGEAVGSIAGQSIGEPSTQMTLNTFHLAGHGGANVTLGIPRLREILMTASQNIKTPSMTIKLKPGVSKQEASRLASRLRMLQLAELIHHKHGVMVTERLRKLGPRPWERLYQIRLQMYDEDVIQQVFGVDYEELMQVVKAKFLRLLLMMLSKEARREVQMGGVIGGAGKKGARGKKGKEDGEDDEAGPMNIEDEAEADLDGVSGKKKPKGAKVVEADDEDEDEEEEEDEDDAQGTLRFGRKNEEQEYDEDDDEVEKDEEGKVVQTRREEKGGEDGEENGGGDSPMDEGKKKGSSGVEGLPVYVSNHPLFEDVKLDAKNGVVEIAVKTRASSRRLLMVTLVESASEKCTVRTSEGISQAFVSDDTVMTAGCNFGELWDAADPEMLDLSTVSSNDIYQVLQTYGVEAARRTIVTEIKNVFGAYGIVVDPRHLGLVADFMTYQGGFRALNRIGMHLASSPFLQMSFETTGAFLTESALAGDIDNLTTPSAKLVVGQPTPNGTGCCSVMVPIAGMSFDKSR